jgi:hypothetical protein
MKIKKDFVLRQVLGALMVMPLGEQSQKLGGMMTLTESGAILWKALEQGCDMDALTKALTDEYDVTEARARADAEKFVEKLTQLGCIEAD